MPPDSLDHNPASTDLDHGLDLAQRLADFYRRDEERRDRQRQHYRETDGACGCRECVSDGPVLIGVAIAEAFARRGIAAARPPVDTPAADVIAIPDQ
jgi:hypothetical protein